MSPQEDEMSEGVTEWGRFRESLDQLAQQHGLKVGLAPSSVDGQATFTVELPPQEPAKPTRLGVTEIRDRAVRALLKEAEESPVSGERIDAARILLETVGR